MPSAVRRRGVRGPRLFGCAGTLAIAVLMTASGTLGWLGRPTTTSTSAPPPPASISGGLEPRVVRTGLTVNCTPPYTTHENGTVIWQFGNVCISWSANGTDVGHVASFVVAYMTGTGPGVIGWSLDGETNYSVSPAPSTPTYKSTLYAVWPKAGAVDLIVNEMYELRNIPSGYDDQYAPRDLPPSATAPDRRDLGNRLRGIDRRRHPPHTTGTGVSATGRRQAGCSRPTATTLREITPSGSS